MLFEAAVAVLAALSVYASPAPHRETMEEAGLSPFF